MKSNHALKLIVILGPNASGKSALAVEIAKRFTGEIISADSRQVYRGMDIGTGKVPLQPCPATYQKFMLSPKKLTTGDRGGGRGMPAGCLKDIPHYLLDVASPKRRFTVVQYKKLALVAIKKILKKGKLPIICGGTGFYIQAVTENLSIPSVKPNFRLRVQLEKKSADELFTLLKKLDPRRAKNIDRYNKRRLIRALEIIYKTGKPVPPLDLKNPPHPSFTKKGCFSLFKGKGEEIFFDTLFIGIKKSPSELKRLIAARLHERLKQGMIAEVKKLRRDGVSWKKLEDFGLEYRWVARYLQDKIGYQEMISRLQKEIEHFAKRQMTWFKKYAPQTHWIKNPKEAKKLIKEFFGR